MANGNIIMCDDLTEYLPEVLNIAKENYEQFFDKRPGTSNQQQIDRSSLTAAGWAACDVWDYQSIPRDWALREAQDESVGG